MSSGSTASVAFSHTSASPSPGTAAEEAAGGMDSPFVSSHSAAVPPAGGREGSSLSRRSVRSALSGLSLRSNTLPDKRSHSHRLQARSPQQQDSTSATTGGRPASSSLRPAEGEPYVEHYQHATQAIRDYLATLSSGSSSSSAGSRSQSTTEGLQRHRRLSPGGSVAQSTPSLSRSRPSAYRLRHRRDSSAENSAKDMGAKKGKGVESESEESAAGSHLRESAEGVRSTSALKAKLASLTITRDAALREGDSETPGGRRAGYPSRDTEASSEDEGSGGVQQIHIAAPSALATALRAEWQAAQRCIDELQRSSDGSKQLPTEQVNAVRARLAKVEMEVLATLRRLPQEVEELVGGTLFATSRPAEGGRGSSPRMKSTRGTGVVPQPVWSVASIRSVVEDFMPYLVAFASTPLPTQRTQSASLAALQGFFAFVRARCTAASAKSATQTGESNRAKHRETEILQRQALREMVDLVFLHQQSDALEAFGFALAALAPEVRPSPSSGFSSAAEVQLRTDNSKRVNFTSPEPLTLLMVSQILELVHEACRSSVGVRQAMMRTESNLLYACLQMVAVLSDFPDVIPEGGSRAVHSILKSPAPAGHTNNQRSSPVRPSAEGQEAALVYTCLERISHILFAVLGSPSSVSPKGSEEPLQGELFAGLRASALAESASREWEQVRRAEEVLCQPLLRLMQRLLSQEEDLVEGSSSSPVAQQRAVALLCQYARLLVILCSRSVAVVEWLMERATCRPSSRPTRPHRELEKQHGRSSVEEMTLCEVLGLMWSSKWADVLELGCLWWVALARDITMRDTDLPYWSSELREAGDSVGVEEKRQQEMSSSSWQREALASLLRYSADHYPLLFARLREALMWGGNSPDLLPYAASVAMCLRWMICACPSVATEVIVAQRELPVTLVKLLLHFPGSWLDDMASGRKNPSASARSRVKSAVGHTATLISADAALWVMEMAFTLSLLFVTGSSATRHQLRESIGGASGTLLHTTSRAELQRRTQRLLLECVEDAYLEDLVAMGLRPASRFTSATHRPRTPRQWRHVLVTGLRDLWQSTRSSRAAQERRTMGDTMVRSGTQPLAPFVLPKPSSAAGKDTTTMYNVKGAPHTSWGAERQHLTSSVSRPAPPVSTSLCGMGGEEEEETSAGDVSEEGWDDSLWSGRTPLVEIEGSFRASSSDKPAASSPRTVPSTVAFEKYTASMFQFRVVARAHQVQGNFLHRSVLTVLRLAQHCSLKLESGVRRDEPRPPQMDSRTKKSHLHRDPLEEDDLRTPGRGEVEKGGECAARTRPQHTTTFCLAASYTPSPMTDAYPFEIVGHPHLSRSETRGKKHRFADAEMEVSASSWLTRNTPSQTPRRRSVEGLTSPSPRPPYPGASTTPTYGTGTLVIHRPTSTNPWAPVQKRHLGRQWGVEALRREDVLLFYFSFGPQFEVELEEAVMATAAHVQYLLEQRRLCPSTHVQRRCVLQDLYANVYPKMHMILLYLQERALPSAAKFSPSARQLLERHDTFIHSGNILELFDAVTHCEAYF